MKHHLSGVSLKWQCVQGVCQTFFIPSLLNFYFINLVSSGECECPDVVRMLPRIRAFCVFSETVETFQIPPGSSCSGC